MHHTDAGTLTNRLRYRAGRTAHHVEVRPQEANERCAVWLVAFEAALTCDVGQATCMGQPSSSVGTTTWRQGAACIKRCRPASDAVLAGLRRASTSEGDSNKTHPQQPERQASMADGCMRLQIMGDSERTAERVQMQEERVLHVGQRWQRACSLAASRLVRPLAKDEQRAVAGRQQRQQQILLAGDVMLLQSSSSSMARQGWESARPDSTRCTPP